MEKVERAILFADVTDSTRIYESLGDAQALAVIDPLLRRLGEVVVRQAGTVVKSLGDGIVCMFADASAAARVACDMQEAVAAHDRHRPHRLTIKIAFTYGPVVLADGDVFGDTVNVCARLASLANSEQVLTNEPTCGALEPALRERCRRLFPIRVKGRLEEVTAYEVLWRADPDLTLANVLRPRQGERVLKLTYGGDATAVLHRPAALRLGRDKANDLVVKSNYASRFHARIVARGGHFLLADQSSNGTFLLPDGGAAEIMLRREEAVLGERGWIGLGHSANEHGEHTLRFRVEHEGD
ncbi:MAG: adenylate/guanylate cyclase domain-containing protein [Burkholderiales bacterium]